MVALVEGIVEAAEGTASVEPSGTSGRLGQKEERTLTLAWRNNGCRASRDRLVSANLGLVVAIAQRYRGRGVALDDLVAEGNLGLVRAVDGFDPDCGARFGTYAAYWIRQGIGRAFAANSPRGRLSAKDRHDVSELERAMHRHYAETCEAPTAAELARALDWSAERVRMCRAMAVSHARPFSIDQSQHTSERRSHEPAAPLSVRAWENDVELEVELDSLLEDLTTLERTAIELRFGLHGVEPQGVDVIAESLQLSRRETRALVRMAMAKLCRKGQLRGARMENERSGQDEAGRRGDEGEE
jgi:RNA polymerase primary sigma factor